MCADDEGRGGIRNPIVSTVLYLNEGPPVGGPTLVTDQTLSSTSIAKVNTFSKAECLCGAQSPLILDTVVAVSGTILSDAALAGVLVVFCRMVG